MTRTATEWAQIDPIKGRSPRLAWWYRFVPRRWRFRVWLWGQTLRIALRLFGIWGGLRHFISASSTFSAAKKRLDEDHAP